MKTSIKLVTAFFLAIAALPAAAQHHGGGAPGGWAGRGHEGRIDNRDGRDYGGVRRDQGFGGHGGGGPVYGGQRFGHERRDGDWGRRERWERRYVAPPVYRPGYAYIAPRGYPVERWRVGHRLPTPYYDSRYYVDPYAYRLNPPPHGYRWVRVDRDVYLVSIASGLISEVMYGLIR